MTRPILKTYLLNKKNIFFITLMSCTIAIIFLFISSSNENNFDQNNSAYTTSTPVSIIKISTHEYESKIKLLGEVFPEWETRLTTSVSGKIENISQSLKSGTLVKKGETLLSIEKAAYEMKLADVKARAYVAQLELLKEKSEAEEALQNWKNSILKNETPSDLLLRIPQLQLAKQNVIATKKAVIFAEKELSDTIIKAPYDGIIKDCNVNIGENIAQGDLIANIFSTAKAKITVYIDPIDFKLLPEDLSNTVVILSNPDTKTSWHGTIARKGYYLKRNSRLMPIFIEVEKPFANKPALLPGEFLTITLSGKKIKDLLKIPEVAYTKKGEIWYVNKKNELARFSSQALFREGKFLFLKPPKNINQLSIVTYPNSSFLTGLKVTPKEIEKGI